MSTQSISLFDVRQYARIALVLALLGVPGSTIAWDLPVGGFWIGLPLARRAPGACRYARQGQARWCRAASG